MLKKKEEKIITVRLKGTAIENLKKGIGYARVHHHPSPPKSFSYVDPEDSDYVIVEQPNGKKTRMKMPK